MSYIIADSSSGSIRPYINSDGVAIQYTSVHLAEAKILEIINHNPTKTYYIFQAIQRYRAESTVTIHKIDILP